MSKQNGAVETFQNELEKKGKADGIWRENLVHSRNYGGHTKISLPLPLSLCDVINQYVVHMGH